MLQCLYEDEDLLVVVKPAGVDSQEAGTFSDDMVSRIRTYLADKGGKRSAYVGVVHRLDKPVKGIMVYAKTLRAAAKLSEQVKDASGRQMEKEYMALVLATAEGEAYLQGHPQGKRTDYVWFQRKDNRSVVVFEDVRKTYPQAVQKEIKQAVLQYDHEKLSAFTEFNDTLQVLQSVLTKEEQKRLHMLRIRLFTGRHHQIRVQLAHMGCPIVGDRKYHAALDDTMPCMRSVPLCLCAARLRFVHPITKREMEFTL